MQNTIIQTSNWNIFQYKDEKWEFLEKKEGSLTEVITYMYTLDLEDLGIEIQTNNNNQIIKFN